MGKAKRRIVITGLGIISPVGIGVETPWEAMMAGQTGIAEITKFDASRFSVKIAGEVQDFDPRDFLNTKEIKRSDLFIQYALAAGQIAMANAGLTALPVRAERAAVVVGTGIGGLPVMEMAAQQLYQFDRRKFSPFFIPKILPNMAAGNLAIRYGAKGPCACPISACASGAHAIGEAVEMLRNGKADFALAGGAEAAITPLAIGGFAAMKALSRRNDAPAEASRPFDHQRDGFVLAEGAAIVVLETEDAAQARGAAQIYAEVLGYGSTGDAHHITAPAPDGDGAVRCMRMALEDAGCDAGAVDYVNAHGTSTRYNDFIETEAIKKVFGKHAYRLAISSTKSLTGHLLGAAGALEACVCALAVHNDRVPPTANFECTGDGDYGDTCSSTAEFTCDPELDYVTEGKGRDMSVRVALSNSFGFGGANACLLFGKPGLPDFVSAHRGHETEDVDE